MEAAIGPRPMADAGIGQKNKITRRWAKRGTRPSAPQDQRTKWAYIFGAICPARMTIVSPFLGDDPLVQLDAIAYKPQVPV